MTAPRPTPLLIGFEGTRLHQTLQQHLLKINPAGIVLFKRNIDSLQQTGELIREVRDLLGPVLVAIDHEGGIVNRFPPDCPSPPSPMALQRSGDTELLEDACRMQAELLASLGINLNLAPVLDLATDDRNPAIGTRAFSGNPSQVAGYGKTFLAAHELLEIGCTAKHFPGHGRSLTDTHSEAGKVSADYETLWENDLLPFRELILSKIPAVMPAHLTYPELDPVVPAMFSRYIIGELLRGKLGFKGLIISDCVEMAAISARYSPEQIARNGLAAGIDLFISSYSLKQSTAFQLSLKHALDAAAEGSQLMQQTARLRLERFQGRYPAIAGKKAGRDMDAETVIAGHGRSIEKRCTRPGRMKCRGIFLLELLSKKMDRINTGGSSGPVASDLVRRLDTVRRHRSLEDCHLSTVAEVIAEANRHRMAIVLITSGGHSHDGYDLFLSKLAGAHQVVHISLIDERDLAGRFIHEWVTWGYNSWTAPALALELDRLLEPEPAG